MAEVLVIQHAATQGPGVIAAALARAGHTLRVVRSDLGEVVPQKLGVGGLVVLGGPFSVVDGSAPLSLQAEQKLISAAIDEGKPVLGVCLGAEMLAGAFGAKVSAAPKREIGWLPVQVHVDADKDPLFADVPRSFTAFHWHGDVFELPRGAQWLAHSAATRHQAFRLGARAWGLLFHLELDAAMVEGMLAGAAAELDGVVDAAMVRADSEKYAAATQALGAQVFAGWAKLIEA